MLLFSGRVKSRHPNALAQTPAPALAFGIVSLTALLLSQPAQAVSFVALGGAGDSFVRANDVSGDGTVVVGTAMLGGRLQAFRWELFQGPIVGLGNLTGDNSQESSARAVSADGTTVVGGSGSILSLTAFSWDASNQMVAVPGPAVISIAAGVSADGSEIAVNGFPGSYVLHGDGTQTELFLHPVGLSDDGLLAPGWFHDSDLLRDFAKVEGGGPLEVHTDSVNDYAESVSADGSIVVGYMRTTETFLWRPLRWVNGEVEEICYEVCGVGDGRAIDVTPDGSTIVGTWRVAGPGILQEAFIWDEVNGMRFVSDLAAAGGIDLSGWNDMTARAISHDGLTIVGSGENPDGLFEPWLFSLRDLPEPSTGLMLATALAFLVAKDRRRIGC